MQKKLLSESLKIPPKDVKICEIAAPFEKSTVGHTSLAHYGIYYTEQNKVLPQNGDASPKQRKLPKRSVLSIA